MTSTNRLLHIDGLRALAILLVVGFHAGLPGFEGGFVGVDIFFVISGFLIISHIVSELGNGAFSFWRFYARRSLRLLPLMLLVIAATTLIAAVVLVSPSEWEWQGFSAVTASLFLSNVYFLIRQGYFDLTTYEKSLLHTWSLSVEEQFYLAVPLILFSCFAVAKKLRARPGSILAIAAVAIFVASLAGCILQTSETGKNPAFYLPHWRAWEFVAGGAVGLLVRNETRGGLTYELSGLAGLGLIFVAVALTGDDHFYPGYMAILPVAGTALAIAGGLARPEGLVARGLSLRILTGIGLVSYGWYLWHWPLISLARIADFGNRSLPRDVAMALLSLGLAIFTYYAVERPIRRWRDASGIDRKGSTVVVYGFVAVLTTAIFSGGVGGAGYLLAAGQAPLTANSDRLVLEAICPEAVCIARPGAKIALTGDSHADRMIETVAAQAARLGMTFERSSGTVDDADVEIILFRWAIRFTTQTSGTAPPGFEGDLEQHIAAAAQRGARVLLVGPVVEFDRRGTECVLRARRYGMDWDTCAVSRESVEARRAFSVAVLTRLASQYPNTLYVDPIDLFCDATLCRPFSGDTIVMKDTDHVTVPYGADWLYYGLRKGFWWALSDQKQ